MGKQREVYYNGSKLSSKEDGVKILKAARLELQTKVFQIPANNNLIPYISTFEFGDAEIQTLEAPAIPQEWAKKFITLLLNKENIVECLNTLCNLDQFGLTNYRNLIVAILNKIPDVQVKEVTNIDKEKKQGENTEEKKHQENTEEKKHQENTEEKVNDSEEEKQQKLANLVVGDPNCTYNEVCDTLSKSKAAKNLWKKLMDVASDLDIPCEDEIAIERGLKTDTKTYGSALREILETWRGKHSKNAKLLTLVQVLEKRDLSGCADALVDKFTSK
ncbi:unnamed protein product [Orchesella dallaii]|uniref:Death domain-containing protein n=1 Tax=Orchesella dallaii TaxID=48710 RepID=A0ABP1R9Y7_9HEXA